MGSTLPLAGECARARARVTRRKNVDSGSDRHAFLLSPGPRRCVETILAGFVVVVAARGGVGAAEAIVALVALTSRRRRGGGGGGRRQHEHRATVSARHHAQPHGRLHGDEPRAHGRSATASAGELRFRETLAAARIAAATARVTHPPHSRFMAVGTAVRHARRHAPQAQQKHRTNSITRHRLREFTSTWKRAKTPYASPGHRTSPSR